jgi:hypothetical protein
LLLGPICGLLYAFYNSVALLLVFATLPDEEGLGLEPFRGVSRCSFDCSLCIDLRDGDNYILAIFVAVPDFGLLAFFPPLPKTDREDLHPS